MTEHRDRTTAMQHMSFVDRLEAQAEARKAGRPRGPRPPAGTTEAKLAIRRDLEALRRQLEVRNQPPPPLPDGWHDSRVDYVNAALAAGIVGVSAWSGGLLFTSIVLLTVALHEAGHLVVARRVGMRPTDFNVGFGPEIFSVARGRFRYAFRIIWFGGYVSIPGMTPKTKLDRGVLEAETYRAASYRQRIAVDLAGVGANIVSGLMVLFIVVLFSPRIGPAGLVLPEPVGRALFGFVAISGFIAVLNALPVPPLDGGRVALIGAEKLWRVVKRDDSIVLDGAKLWPISLVTLFVLVVLPILLDLWSLIR